MKKIIAIALLLCMVLVMGAWTADGGEYKLGMGVVVSTNSSKTNNAQVDATVAAVVVDKDGKIVACRIDCAQARWMSPTAKLTLQKNSFLRLN